MATVEQAAPRTPETLICMQLGADSSAASASGKITGRGSCEFAPDVPFGLGASATSASSPATDKQDDKQTGAQLYKEL